MFDLMDYEIDRLIEEDLPYLDLTSHLLGLDRTPGRIRIFSRESGVVCGTEEVGKIFAKMGVAVEFTIPSGTVVGVGEDIILGVGLAPDLHKAWKISQTLLDHCSGIATKTRNLLERLRKNHPTAMLLTTRKTFPGTRKLAIKGILAGGALPHRLNLSETILVFENHVKMIGGFEALLRKIPEMKAMAIEKKIVAEATTEAEARGLVEAGVDVIQFDKVEIGILKEWIRSLKRDYPRVSILVAGGIGEDTIDAYSDPDIDGVVTSALYDARPLDLGTSITPL